MAAGSARVRPVAIARARVTRATGETEIHYSFDRPPLWQVRRRLKLRKHLRFMKGEDKQWH